MKKIKIILVFLIAMGAIFMEIQGCKVSKEIGAKPGGQLWAENCVRCHNVPSPTDFSDAQWELISTHMRVRANLTEMETNKIIEFLSRAN